MQKESCFSSSGMVFARVLSLEGAHALVRIEEGCGRCHEAGGCGGVAFARLLGRAGRLVRAPNACNAQPGERVCLLLPARALSRLATLLYGLPLAGLLLGAVAGNTLGDVAALAGGVAGFALSLGALFFLSRRAENPGDELSLRRFETASFPGDDPAWEEHDSLRSASPPVTGVD
jgi:sigma-E factor negative regulatory protein RseC